MSNNPLVDSFEIIASDKDTHFTGAIAQNATEEENIAFPTEWSLIQCHKCEISNVSLESDQPLTWEVLFFATDAHGDTDLDLDRAVTSLTFSSADAKRIGGANQYRYNLDPATFPFTYIDEDRSSEFHISLINRDATAKNSGATGEVVLTIHAVPIM